MGAEGFAIGTFIDTDETFNTTLGVTIEAVLGRYEISNLVRSWINNMLACRMVTAAKGGTSVGGRVILGSLQGRVTARLRPEALNNIVNI